MKPDGDVVTIMLFNDLENEYIYVSVKSTLGFLFFVTLVVGLIAKYIFDAELVGTICIVASVVLLITRICLPLIRKARIEKIEKRKQEEYERTKEEREAREKELKAKKEAQDIKDRTCSQCHQVAGRWIRKEEWHSRQVSKFVKTRPYDNIPSHYVYGVEYENVDVYQCQDCNHVWYVSRGWRTEWNRDVVDGIY